jgi:glycine C-acetyltransferase
VDDAVFRNRDMVAGSTKTRALNSLYEWLEQTNHLELTGRVSKGTPNHSVIAKYSADNSPYKKLIHLGSYNYSGLNGHPDIINEATKVLAKYGTTTSGVRLLNGTTDLHIEFEKRLAQFLGFEDALTYSSGYAANISTLSALCSDKDIVFCDHLNHQSLIDGLKLSEAKIIKFPHRNYEALAHALKDFSKIQRKFIITDGIFSMDGDIANLKILVELANEYNSFLIVDDAHATAALGPNGRGTPAYFNLGNDIDLLTGSLSKGLPGIGGFAAGKKRTIDMLRYGSNGYIFSASIPAPILAGLIVSLDILEKNPEIQSRLHNNERQLREGIKQIGLNVMHSETPIIPILLPNRDTTFLFARKLHELGVYANAICFPAVSRHHPRLRLNASAALSQEDINKTLWIIEKVAKELNLNRKEVTDECLT